MIKDLPIQRARDLSRRAHVAQLIFYFKKKNFNHGWTRMDTDFGTTKEQRNQVLTRNSRPFFFLSVFIRVHPWLKTLLAACVRFAAN